MKNDKNWNRTHISELLKCPQIIKLFITYWVVHIYIYQDPLCEIYNQTFLSMQLFGVCGPNCNVDMCMWGRVCFPHTKQFSDTTRVSQNSTHFSHHLPRVNIRFYKLRAQSHKTDPIYPYLRSTSDQLTINQNFP